MLWIAAWIGAVYTESIFLLPKQDIQYTDIDYMEEKKDFTYDKVKFQELPEFYDYLHEKGQRYIPILVRSTSLSKKIK